MQTISIDQQINSDNFLAFCDYFYSPTPDYPYALQVLAKYPHLKIFTPWHPMDSKVGIIFVGMCTQVEKCFEIMPEDGNYIVIQRDNERTFIEAYYAKKKASCKHVYTIECGVQYPDMTALPHGVASIEGPNFSVEQIRLEEIPEAERPIFCRLNTNPITHARTAAIEKLRDNSLVDIIDHQLAPLDFFRQVKAHRFALALQSGGKDTTRIWEALCLGTIPIISDVPELRYFEDMPVAYFPADGVIDQAWIDSIDMSRKSLKRATMIYWKELILEHKRQLCQL